MSELTERKRAYSSLTSKEKICAYCEYSAVSYPPNSFECRALPPTNLDPQISVGINRIFHDWCGHFKILE